MIPHVSGIYIEIDRIKCWNVLDLLSLEESGGGFVSPGLPNYDLSLLPNQDRALIQIDAPFFFVTGRVEDVGYESAAAEQASRFMRKFASGEAAKSLSVSSVVVMMVIGRGGQTISGCNLRRRNYEVST